MRGRGREKRLCMPGHKNSQSLNKKPSPRLRSKAKFSKTCADFWGGAEVNAFLQESNQERIFCVVIFTSWNTIFDEVIVPAPLLQYQYLLEKSISLGI